MPVLLRHLIIWLLKREIHPYLDYHGRESVNFQITMHIAGVISGVLCFLLIGMLLVPLVILFNLVFVIIAGIKANDGVSYRYPLCIRFL